VRATDTSGKSSIGNIDILVSDTNDAPTGAVTISGTTSQGEELTAVTTTLADEDGLGELNYQWLRDGSDISGATSSTYTLAQDDVGSAISVKVSYSDDGDTVEEVVSGVTAGVTPPPAFDIIMTSAENDVVTFEIYADASTDPNNDGTGSFEFTLSHDPSDMLIDISSYTPGAGYSNVPNYDSTTGILQSAAFALPNVTDASIPLATFDATILDDTASITVMVSDILVDTDSYASVAETFDLSLSGDILSPATVI
jgi:hypothetical protein